jgi:hypothetical protein
MLVSRLLEGCAVIFLALIIIQLFRTWRMGLFLAEITAPALDQKTLIDSTLAVCPPPVLPRTDASPRSTRGRVCPTALSSKEVGFNE